MRNEFDDIELHGLADTSAHFDILELILWWYMLYLNTEAASHSRRHISI